MVIEIEQARQPAAMADLRGGLTFGSGSGASIGGEFGGGYSASLWAGSAEVAPARAGPVGPISQVFETLTSAIDWVVWLATSPVAIAMVIITLLLVVVVREVATAR